MQLVKLLTLAAAFAGFAIAKPIEGSTLDEPTSVPSAPGSNPGTDAKNRKYDRDYNRRYDHDYNRKYDHDYNRQYDREYNRHYDREYNREYDVAYFPEYPPTSTVTTIIITVTPSAYVNAATATAAL